MDQNDDDVVELPPPPPVGMTIPEIIVVDSPSDTLETSSFLSSGLITSSSPSLTSPPIVNGGCNFIEEANEGDDDDEDDDDNDEDEEYNTDDDDDCNSAEALLKSSVGGLVTGINGIPQPGSINGTSNGSSFGSRGLGGSDGQPLVDLNKLTPTMTKASPESPVLKEPSESSDMDEFEVQCPCDSHEGKEMVNRVVGVSIDQALKMLFSDSKFFNEFHLSRRTTDMVHSDWQDHEAGKIRQVTYTLALNLSVGPKTAQTTETQIMHKCSNPGKMYCIEVDAITTGVPYCDAFFTHHQHCLTRVSNNECRVKVHSQIKYKKSVWGLVKSIIERNTWSGLDDFFKGLDAALIKETNVALLNQPPKPKKPRKQRRPSDKFKIKIENAGTLETPDIQQSWRLPAISSHKDTARSAGSDILVPIILVVLIMLLILNALLYYKLWALEASTNRNVFPSFIIDSDLLRTPKSNDDWVRLIHQQEALHQAEVTKWREVIDTVVSVLRETEDSLVSLRQNMHSRTQYTSGSSSEAQDSAFDCQSCAKHK